MNLHLYWPKWKRILAGVSWWVGKTKAFHKTLKWFLKRFAYLGNSSSGSEHEFKANSCVQIKKQEMEKEGKTSLNNVTITVIFTLITRTHTHTPASIHTSKPEDLYSLYTCGASFLIRSSKLLRWQLCTCLSTPMLPHPLQLPNRPTPINPIVCMQTS